MRFSIYEGAFVIVYANLTGSVFLPGFALALGADSLHIGILASAPFFANLAQLGGAFLVERFNHRKTITVLAAMTARSIWLPIIILSALYAVEQPLLVMRALIVLAIASHIFAALSGVSWLSWMATVVPEEIRGRYFGLRNAVLGACNIAITLLAAQFLDIFGQGAGGGTDFGAFHLLFAIGVASGFSSILFLANQPGPRERRDRSTPRVLELYTTPLKLESFRRLLRFAVLWSLVVNCAAPFFVVYQLQTLKLSYTFVAAMAVAAASFDLAGMWIWGHLSDRFGNKPVMVMAASVLTVVPMLWLFTSTDPLAVYVGIPLLHITGGFFWAGYNLCSVNLVFQLAPKERNAAFFATWAACNGIAAGAGTILGGLLVKLLAAAANRYDFALPGIEFKLIFVLSGALRIISLLFLRQFKEPRSLPTVKAIRILRNVRSWATMMGFHPVLHYFLPQKRNVPPTSEYWPIWQRSRRRAQRQAASPDAELPQANSPASSD